MIQRVNLDFIGLLISFSDFLLFLSGKLLDATLFVVRECPIENL